MHYKDLMLLLLFCLAPSFAAQNTQWKKYISLKSWCARTIYQKKISSQKLPFPLKKEIVARDIAHILSQYVGQFAQHPKKIAPLQSIQHDMHSMCFSPDDTKLILGCNFTMAGAIKQNNVYVYDIKRKKFLDKPNSININPNGRCILHLSNSSAKNILIFTPEKRFRQLTHMQKEYESKNGKYAITLDDKSNLILIDKVKNLKKNLIKNIEPNDIAQLDFNQDASQGAFLGGFFNMPKVFTVAEEPLIQQLSVSPHDQETQSECTTLAFSNQSNQLAVAQDDHSLCIWQSHSEHLKECTHIELAALLEAVKSWQNKKPHQICQKAAKDIPEIYKNDPQLFTLIAGESA